MWMMLQNLPMGLFAFWTLSIVFLVTEHNVSETGSVLVFRWWDEEDLLNWGRRKELLSITGQTSFITHIKKKKKKNNL
jgi:hypothetical protein